jgi:hypothetical protein
MREAASHSSSAGLPDQQGGGEAHGGHQVDVVRRRARGHVPQGVVPQEYRQGGRPGPEVGHDEPSPRPEVRRAEDDRLPRGERDEEE